MSSQRECFAMFSFFQRSMPKRGAVILVKHARAVLCMQISTRARPVSYIWRILEATQATFP